MDTGAPKGPPKPLGTSVQQVASEYDNATFFKGNELPPCGLGASCASVVGAYAVAVVACTPVGVNRPDSVLYGASRDPNKKRGSRAVVKQ